MNFCEYFPQVCSKYRCDDVPSVREICQDSTSSIRNEKIDLVDSEANQTNLIIELSSTQLPFNKKEESTVSIKNNENVVRKHPKETDHSARPVIVPFFKKHVKEKRLHQLSLKNVEINILLILALLDAVRPEKYLQALDISMCKASANVIHGIRKIVILSNITELTLDNSHIPQLNCVCILSSTTSLKRLSLSKCRINDCGVGLLADQLHYSKASAQNLEVLNLTSNLITDCGALYLAESLRSNRSVSSLILAGNSIKDAGCCEIAKSLKCFCLRKDEMDSIRKIYTESLVKRQDLFEKYVNEKLCTAGGQIKSNGNHEIESSNDQSNTSLPFCEVELQLIEKFVTVDDYPFRCSELFCHNDNIYCVGNNTLINLNLAFNYVGPRGIRYLINSIEYQIDYERKGIDKIVLEGNPDVFYCPEYHILSEIM